MAITALSTTGLSQYVAASSSLSQIQKTLQPLQQSLASGNLSAAKSVFASEQNLNQDVVSLSEDGLSSSSQLSTDLTTLGTALDSGDLATAQKAFATVKSDLKTSQSQALTTFEKSVTQTVSWVNDLFTSSTSSSSSSSLTSDPIDAATSILETAYGLNSSSNKADPMVAFLESKYGLGKSE
jgi:hypothetical protein